VDWDEKSHTSGVYLLKNKKWDKADWEKGNYDYLMGADLDLTSEKVIGELVRWGKWYLDTVALDGFRLDAVKHIDYAFYGKWLADMREHAGRDLFAVGEYWSDDIGALKAYLSNCGHSMSLFDVPLHFNFYNASENQGNFDMRHLLDGSLVGEDGDHAVTFVDNHDSQPGQSLSTWVQQWFKPLAYAVILLRRDGFPCVYYSDYYGLANDGASSVPGLKRQMYVRKKYAYGEQHDYFDHENIVGWTREGDNCHANSGCVVLLSDGPGGMKEMYVGKRLAGRTMRDVTRRERAPIRVGKNGSARFETQGGGVSIWVLDAAYRDITLHCE
jgi:alpha-amylase